MTPEEEKKNRRIGMIYSLGIHALVILLFAFLMAWREPNPPLPEYGIELNFGLDDAGTGDVQPLTPAVASESQEEAAPEEESSEIQEVETPPEPPQESSEETVDKTETFEDTDSPEVVEKVEEVKEVKEQTEEVKKETEQTKTDPVVTPSEKKTENITDEGAQGKDGESKEAEAANQGDKTDQTGDQGNEEGSVDARALYGNQGGGGGSSLELAGWKWDFEPKPKDPSDESGKIIFEITIDDRGYIISVKTIEKTVSPTVEAIYKAEVEKLTFSKDDNRPAAPQSKGRITFLIKSN